MRTSKGSVWLTRKRRTYMVISIMKLRREAQCHYIFSRWPWVDDRYTLLIVNRVKAAKLAAWIWECLIISDDKKNAKRLSEIFLPPISSFHIRLLFFDLFAGDSSTAILVDRYGTVLILSPWPVYLFGMSCKPRGKRCETSGPKASRQNFHPPLRL
jgi:hypothetical protein